MGPDDPAEALRSELSTFEKTRALLARKPGIVQALAPLVALYRPGGTWWEFRRGQALGKPGLPAQLRRKGQALARAVQHVEGLVLDRAVATWLTRGGIILVDPRLADLPETLAVLRREAERIAASTRSGGRPSDPWRDRFCRGVAGALKAAGEPVTKARDGLFAQALAAAFMAAGEIPPEDLFPLVRRSA